MLIIPNTSEGHTLRAQRFRAPFPSPQQAEGAASTLRLPSPPSNSSHPLPTASQPSSHCPQHWGHKGPPSFSTGPGISFQPLPEGLRPGLTGGVCHCSLCRLPRPMQGVGRWALGKGRDWLNCPLWQGTAEEAERGSSPLAAQENHPGVTEHPNAQDKGPRGAAQASAFLRSPDASNVQRWPKGSSEGGWGAGLCLRFAFSQVGWGSRESLQSRAPPLPNPA